MFKDYKALYSGMREQHNIMVLVGNGFDIGVLNKYQISKYMGRTTRYSDFYDYITFYKMCSNDNCIYKEMTARKDLDLRGWSDFELIIDDLIKPITANYSQLEKDLDELQKCFSSFLQEIVSLDVIDKVSKTAIKNGFAVKSLGEFLSDLDSNSSGLIFPTKTEHYHLYNFLFVNFNYTYILDNYIYLDKTQFDPHKYKTVDRNFTFYPNPNNRFEMWNKETALSSYLLTSVIHPHGTQSVPRSLLFGTEIPDYSRNGNKKRFIKSYWGQNDVRYKESFEKVELFIIYGMSMGKTDSWWLSNIYRRLLAEEAELIIYRHRKNSDYDETRELFVSNCIFIEKVTDEDKRTVFSRIYVVDTENNDSVFLGLPQ